MHTLSLANSHDQLIVMSAWIEEIASASAIPPQTAFRLELVLTEAVTNIMDYSRRPGEAGHIQISCELHDDTIEVVVNDDGPAFDPTARASVSLPKSLDEARPGGLGIHLMRQYASAMSYRREHDRNILAMTLPIHRSSLAV